ncbi:MAG: efflux RND transporter periplasmic adaptor subunit [Magnetococcus sp. DMHC-1]|nr:efflux RND transporter periplasmic adaptor subunit [Magnetococcales bacterium]
MEMGQRLFGMMLILACAGSVMTWGKTSTAAAPPHAAEANPVLTVTVAMPQQENWPLTLLVSGGIHAWQESVVASEIGGLAVTSLLVDVGSQVKRGQELARLSDATLQAVLVQHRANVARTEANLALAASNANRARDLKGSSAMSEQQSTQYLLTEKAVRAELEAVKAAMGVDEVRLRQTHILAADDGVITARNATLGSVVQVGGDMFRLLRQGRLEWRAELTAGQMARVQAGVQARLSLDDGQTLNVVARQVAPVLDPNNRRGLVYFDLPPGSAFRAGMFVQGEIQLGTTGAMTLPQSAIVMHDGNAYVFEMTTGERVVQRKISTGRRQGQRVEITAGVQPDTRVVVAGGAFLHDGDRVRVVTGDVTP